MAQLLHDLLDLDEDEQITCSICNKIMDRDSTTDDFNFAWDNVVEVDSCSDCYLHTLKKENENDYKTTS